MPITSHETSWSPAASESIECLQIVYKIAERCNINCTYCYYFNMGDSTPLERPARATHGDARQLACWIAQGVTELRIPRVRISFHGGEPMLVSSHVFDQMCKLFADIVGSVAEVSFAVQTNGTILDEAWLQVFARHRVAIGVSIDGGRTAHDRHRLDHRGRSTFDRTMGNLRRLVDAAHGDPTRLPTTISVLDPHVDYTETYTWLRGLGIEGMAFLLPDRSAEDTSFRDGAEPARVGARLAEVFEAWLTEGNPRIRVRFIDDALRSFRVGAQVGPSQSPRKIVQILVARSDGTVTIDDSYTPALRWYEAAPVYAVTDTTLQQLFEDPIFLQIEALQNQLPGACAECRWRRICRGGDLENRFHPANGFDNPSIYCTSYKVFYSRVCTLLAAHGYPADEIQRRFGELIASHA